MEMGCGLMDVARGAALRAVPRNVVDIVASIVRVCRIEIQ